MLDIQENSLIDPWFQFTSNSKLCERAMSGEFSGRPSEYKRFRFKTACRNSDDLIKDLFQKA